jgi:hypothetical protein
VGVTAFQFWSYYLTAYSLRGNAYAVIERDDDGNPVELIPVTPDRVTVRLSPVDGAPWYLVNAKQIGIAVLVPMEDMLHLRKMSVDGYLLKSDLRRRIVCPSTLALLDLIVEASNPQEPLNLYFDGDDLFAPFRRRRGLPIGNLTSQFFANLYLDGFDHFVSEVLRAPYLRYVDDFALFHHDAAVLTEWRARIERYLVRRRLRLHPGKTAILSSRQSAQFLGFELHADGRRRLPEDNVRRFRNRLRGLCDQWRAGTIDLDDVDARVGAWIAHAEHADTWRLRDAIFRGGRFDPANAPEAWPAPCRRVVRGGSWNNNPQKLRAANRNRNTTDNRTNNLGFRVGRTLSAGAGVIMGAPGAP